MNKCNGNPRYVLQGTLNIQDIQDIQDIADSPMALVVHAAVNGQDVARAAVDARGRYRLEFEGAEAPATTELRVLPAKGAERVPRTMTLSKMLSPTHYVHKDGAFQAYHDILIPRDYLRRLLRVTETYRIHGVLYAQYPTWLQTLPDMKISFYEVDLNWPLWSKSASYLGTAYSRPDGSYEFTFSFSYMLLQLFADRKPDIQVRISRFADGDWEECYESTVDWNITKDFHRDFLIPAADIVPVPDPGAKPVTGFRFTSVGLLPIDSTRIHKGYATSQIGDPVQGIAHQPFCDTLRIFGLFADSPAVASYTVEIAPADDSGPIGPWRKLSDPLHNREWNSAEHRWQHRVLGPDPESGRYRNIDTQPSMSWHEHALKITWNTRNEPDGYYALRITAFDASGTAGEHHEMPVMRIDNSRPAIDFDMANPGTGACGNLTLPADRKLTFRVTAYDHAGHMKSYAISATRGKDALAAGTSVSRARPDSAAGWVGVHDHLEVFDVASLPSALASCPALAYSVELTVCGLATNGYHATPGSQYVRRELNLIVA